MGRTMKVSTLKKLVASGEGPELEFKRSTGELREVMQTLCGFLNTGGGVVLLGVDRKGKLEGQQVSENTIHEITQAFDRFEPPVNVTIERTSVEGDREVVALSVTANQESVPFTYDGRAFVRVGNTTRRMGQARYEELLLERAHARRRWENLPAVGVSLDGLDHEEILRTREDAIRNRRIPAATPADAGEILADAVIELMKKTGMPNGLSAVGYSEKDVDKLVEGTLPQHRVTKLCPRPFTPEDLRELFLDSLTLW